MKTDYCDWTPADMWYVLLTYYLEEATSPHLEVLQVHREGQADSCSSTKIICLKFLRLLNDLIVS